MREGQTIARYGGVTQIRVNNANNSNLLELGAFITWRELQLGENFDIAELY
ncbi:unnamed protein product [Laminaria digitata]